MDIFLQIADAVFSLGLRVPGIREMNFGDRQLVASVKVISGVLLIVRLTTCKRLTKSLPKLSLITLPPPETAG